MDLILCLRYVEEVIDMLLGVSKAHRSLTHKPLPYLLQVEDNRGVHVTQQVTPQLRNAWE